jgi:hypothetical protein
VTRPLEAAIRPVWKGVPAESARRPECPRCVPARRLHLTVCRLPLPVLGMRWGSPGGSVIASMICTPVAHCATSGDDVRALPVGASPQDAHGQPTVLQVGYARTAPPTRLGTRTVVSGPRPDSQGTPGRWVPCGEAVATALGCPTSEAAAGGTAAARVLRAEVAPRSGSPRAVAPRPGFTPGPIGRASAGEALWPKARYAPVGSDHRRPLPVVVGSPLRRRRDGACGGATVSAPTATARRGGAASASPDARRRGRGRRAASCVAPVLVETLRL